MITFFLKIVNCVLAGDVFSFLPACSFFYCFVIKGFYHHTWEKLAKTRGPLFINSFSRTMV